jgi:predicted ATPase
MPALDYITIEGFKSIASISKLEMRPINLLIGPNGAGKSNFIGAFSFLQSLMFGHLQTTVRKAGGADQILHFGAKTTKQLHFLVSFRGEVNQYGVWLQAGADDSLFVAHETCYFWNKQLYSRPFSDGLTPRDGGREAGISGPDLTRTASWVKARIGGWRVYHVHDTSETSPMRRTCSVADNEFLRPDGSNLAAFLYFLEQKHPDSFRMITRTVQQIAPFLDAFVLRPERLNEDTIRLAWKHKNSDQYFHTSSLSDGTLRFIALTTLFMQPAEFRPSVILVDEPELGLHPAAVTLLASLARHASTTTQVVMSTQSPLLLDHFEPEDVLVASRHSGATQVERLDAIA